MHGRERGEAKKEMNFSIYCEIICLYTDFTLNHFDDGKHIVTVSIQSTANVPEDVITCKLLCIMHLFQSVYFEVIN